VRRERSLALVGVIMGSTSDWDTMRGSADTLKSFAVAFEAVVVSAHRTPEWMAEYAKAAEGRGLEVIIAGRAGPRTCRGWWRPSRCCRCSGCRWRARP